MNHGKPAVGSGMTTNNDEWGRMVCHGSRHVSQRVNGDVGCRWLNALRRCGGLAGMWATRPSRAFRLYRLGRYGGCSSSKTML